LLFLIGYRATGKTTTAQLLAEQLGWQCCDADAVLEERFGKSIRQIFADEGEAGFRDKESAVLEELCRRTNHVIATGGGIVLRPENRARLRQGRVVWLTAPPNLLWRRLQEDATTAERRPNLAGGGVQEIEEMLAARTPLYQQCADLTIDTTTRTPAEVAVSIATWARGF
jgi:shikimate kinase